MTQELYWEEDLHRQRLQGVGALALDWLMSSVQVALRGAKTYLDKSISQSVYSKKGRLVGKMQMNIRAFRNRLQSQDSKSFERIQDLCWRETRYSREDNGNLETYVAKIKKPAFVDYARLENTFSSREPLSSPLLTIPKDSLSGEGFSEIGKTASSQESRTTLK